MVTYTEVAKRHTVYVACLALIVLFARHAVALACVLCIALGLLAKSLKTPIAFSAYTGFGGSAAVSVCAVFSRHTLWFADGLSHLEVPVWLPCALGVGAHWALDLFYITTLVEARKSTLP